MADIAYDSGYQNTAAANNVTVTTGTVTDGKVLFAWCIGSSSASANWTAPGGWTNLVQSINPNGNPVAVFYIVASSLATTHNFACSDSSVANVAIAIYANNDTGTALDATTTAGSGTASTITVPSITTVTDRALHLVLLWEHNAPPASTPSGYTADYLALSSGIRFCSKIITPAGSVSGVTSSGGTSWNAISIAVRPAAATTTRGTPFGSRGNAFNGGRTLLGITR